MRLMSVGIAVLCLLNVASAQMPALKGRRILTAAEMAKKPYCYVGRVVNERTDDTGKKTYDAIGGTATLIGRRHILTAAHVIEDADALDGKTHVYEVKDAQNQVIQKTIKLGSIFFVLPDGRRSEIDQAELDGGWPRHRLTSYDFGVCTLKDPLGDVGGHASWGVFEDDDSGQQMTMTGYDFDLAGATRPPPLIVRTGSVSQQRGGAKMALIGTAAMLDGLRANGFVRGIYRGVGFAALAQGVLIQQHVSVGWKGNFYAAEGSSGGPIWIDRSGIPTVIGVQATGFDINGDKVGEFSLGSRITAGPAEDMVRDHILRNR